MEDNNIGYGTCNMEFADGSKLECKGTNAAFVETLGALQLKSSRGDIVSLKCVSGVDTRGINHHTSSC